MATVFWLFFVPASYESAIRPSSTFQALPDGDIQLKDGPLLFAPPKEVVLTNLAEKLKPKTKIERPPGDPRQTTIVSAFFNLAKQGHTLEHSPSFYMQSGGDGVLSFDSLVVFFTDSPAAVREVHAKHAPATARLYIVETKLEDFDVVKEHLARVRELIKRDHEATNVGNPGELLMIWNAKPEMMRIAAQMNVFNTEKFLWMDLGCVRTWGGIKREDFYQKRFPAPQQEQYLGRDGKILLGNVAGHDGPCKDNVRWVPAFGDRKPVEPASKLPDALQTTAEPFHWWIAGAIWGGRGKDLAAYERLYRVTLKRYLDADLDKYSLIDQYLMGALACSSSMVEVAQAPRECCVDRVNRKWFYLLLFFSDKPIPLEPYEPGEKRISGGPCMYCKKD